MPGVATLAVHQLTADLIEYVSHARRVLFIDASTTGEEIAIKPVIERNSPPGHVFGPAALLGLARGIHGSAPDGWLLPVPGFNFDFGEELSPAAATVVPAAKKAVLDWINDGEEPCSHPRIDNVE